jgi:peptidoglycan/LPS O-acetylase OafA/YrhL
MAKTEERLRTIRQTPQTTDLSRGSAVRLMLAWAILFPVSIVLEPAAAAGETMPWWGALASFALLGGMIATFIGLGRRRRWGVGASLVASSIFLAGVFACPATGHHAFGLWWIGEFAAAAALVGISAAAYLRRA